MKNPALFCATLLLALFSCQTKNTDRADIPESARPNILWLVAEDLSPVIPPFGDSTIVCPNLSRLAAEGVCYTNVFSVSGVCAPSRAALATGMYPTRIGATHMRTNGNPAYFAEGVHAYEAMPGAGVRMHSEYLRMAGYYCTNNAKEDYQFTKPLTAWDESSRTAHWRNRADGQPFFAIFNFGVTHESRIWVKAEDSLWVAEDLQVEPPPYLPDNEVGQRDVRRMYSNVKEMDAQIGKVLDQLEEDGLLDHTIVVWYSDHGGPLPRQKRLNYDSGLKVPMIIRYPDGKGAGSYDDQLISFVDFAPTLLSMAGLEPPSHFDGRAFAGKYKDSVKRAYIHAAGDRFDACYDHIRAVRDSRYKYLRNFWPDSAYYLPVSYREQMPVMQELLRMRDAGELDVWQAQWFRERKPEEELFDTEADPHELHNLAGEPAYREKLEELRIECERWMASTNDMGLLDEADYIARIWPGDVQPLVATPLLKESGDSISLSCETEGALIGYQFLNMDEAAGDRWMIYTGPLMLPQGKRLVAVADRIGYKASTVLQYPE
ncbi:MAG: sulfatase [Bacteroidetes bacterium]|nr:MAG: sulfatase [Bacteroidota bacterium]